MKFVKALDKVRQQRLKQISEAGKAPVEVKLQAAEPMQSEEQWKAPVYSQSTYMVPHDMTAMLNRCVCLRDDSPVMDYYKVLRTQLLQRMKPKGWNTVMVTSTRPGEGKTLTTINLALTFAMAYNHTVLLVDCDLRKQSVYHHLGIDSDKGIVDYLADSRPLSDLIIWPKVDKLTLISGGRTVRNSAELLGSPRMSELMVEMKSRYSDRYVIVDAPPILAGADTLALAPLVDGIVIVVESGGPSIREIREALALIPKEKFLGFVLNKHGSQRNAYYQYYNGE